MSKKGNLAICDGSNRNQGSGSSNLYVNIYGHNSKVGFVHSFQPMASKSSALGINFEII